MGIVWAATHVVTRKVVAIKLLHGEGAKDPKFVSRFLREARAACAVQHPNVVTIHDVLEVDDKTPAMVMELLLGESLGQRLDRVSPLPLGEVAQYLLPVISAVGTAHSLGIVHRDLKPDNIFLRRTPDGVDVKVLDFGIAKLTATEGDAAATGHLTGTGAMLGTPYYMAPEQIFGDKDIDHRADVWALGIILFECLTGQRPTQADNIGQILKIVTTNKIPKLVATAPNVAQDVSALVDRMLSRDRDDRPQLSEVKNTLARYADVRVRSFAEPVPRASESAPTLGDTGARVLIRTGDKQVSAMDATQAAQAGTGPKQTGGRTFETTSQDKHEPAPKKARGVVVVGALAAAVVGSLLVARALTSTTPVPPTTSAAAATSVVPIASSSIVTPVASTTPAAAPSAAPSASTSAAPKPTARPVVKPHPSASASAAPVATPTKQAGGVVERPPF